MKHTIKKKILYIAFNGLTLEVQSYLSEMDYNKFDIVMIVPEEIDLYGVQIDYQTAHKINKVKYIKLKLKEPPFTFFPEPKNNRILNSLLIKFQPDLIVIQSALFHPNALAVINSKFKYCPKAKILNFAATQYRLYCLRARNFLHKSRTR